MILAEQTINAVRDLAVEDVLTRYVAVKRQEACCPFHNEKTPSFRINTKKNYYKCFGCGKAGDGIRFVMEHQKLSFIEAVETIAKAHNINIEYNQYESEEIRAEKRSKLETAHAILHYAHEYYRKALQQNPAVKAYLLERGYDDDKIEEWQLGYAPDAFKNIATHIINQGWYDVALELGLISTTNATTFDVYRNRIIIPIHDKHGQIIGFGGRLVSGEGPKYINPNENFLYSKSTVLFGLDRAINAIKAEKRAFLVEGYFDVMSCAKAGVENIVAPCGTACDEKQLQLLKRYTDTVVIMYDGDSAGEKAQRAAIIKAIKQGLNVLAVGLDNIDPDEMARSYTPTPVFFSK